MNDPPAAGFICTQSLFFAGDESRTFPNAAVSSEPRGKSDRFIARFEMLCDLGACGRDAGFFFFGFFRFAFSDLLSFCLFYVFHLRGSGWQTERGTIDEHLFRHKGASEAFN